MTTTIRKRIKGTIGRIAGSSGAISWRYRSKMISVAFHRVNDALPDDGITHSSATFRQYCEFFAANFRVVPLSEQVDACTAGETLGGTLSITLDDGYRDNFEVAAPILQRLKLPATFFVVSGFVGTQTVAPWDSHLLRQPGWMNWDQLRLLVSQGFEIGGHTESHVDLGTTDAETARLELEVSRRKLQERLDRPVKLFAYPFGGRNNICEPSRELVRTAGFSCCLSCFGGVNVPGTNPFAMNRIPIVKGFVNPEQFGFDLAFGRIVAL
jgi:peptidoglycan/xylan/chitin deacetylase (PgdA/CDA1 family)